MAEKSERISTSVSPELRNEVEQTALERSEPGNRVTVSDVIRDALRDHFDDEGGTER